jgi:ribosomal protein L37AE/L43A
MASQSAVTAKSYYCNHCRNQLPKAELTPGTWLCVTCRATPGVRGYGARLPATGYGSAASSEEYWNATKHQLNIVVEPEADASPAPDTKTSIPEPARSGFETWQADVAVDRGLLPDEKLYLLTLARFADWQTGANCFPSYRDQGDALSLTTRQVRRLRRRVITKGWIVAWRRHQSWRRTSDLYQFRRPPTAKHGAWDGPVSARYGTLTHGKSIECPSRAD